VSKEFELHGTHEAWQMEGSMCAAVLARHQFSYVHTRAGVKHGLNQARPFFLW